MKKKEHSFEEALALLEEAADKLRSGRLSLEESTELYEKSLEYYDLCTSKLEAARQKIRILDPDSGKAEEFEDYER